MTAFTKGPWNIHYAYPLDRPVRTTNPDGDWPSFNYWSGVIAQGETIIGETRMQSASVGWPHVTDVEEARANTWLIVSSPLMYAALKDVEWANDGRCPQCCARRENVEHLSTCLIGNALRAAEGRVIA